MEITPIYILLHLLLFSLPTSTFSQEQKACLKNELGYTSPRGDIKLEYGKDSLSIFCSITKPQTLKDFPNVSKYLHFWYGSYMLNSSIVNSTTIRLYIDKDLLQISSTMYSCMMNKSVVCDNVVFVAEKPKPYDFRCISKNNDNLTCSWAEPENSLSTSYQLSYAVHYDSNKTYKCPKIKLVKDRRFECVWSPFTIPEYRQSATHLNFTLIGDNALGSIQIDLPFDHLAHILANPPEDLKLLNNTTSSLLLKWKIPLSIIHRQLQYRVMYKCGLHFPEAVRDQDFKLAAINSITNQKTCIFNLTGLPYANDLCDIRVSLRVMQAMRDDMWSQNATIFKRTGSTNPSEGPKLAIGSYRHINDSAVRIYWHQVPEQFKNGANLVYNISLVKGFGNVLIDRSRVMKNSAVVANVSPEHDYTFELWASNDEGMQRTPNATITIPARGSKRPFKVRELKKIEYPGGFKLQWKPREPLKLTNYTVFWCREITKSFSEDCNGDWNWKSVAFNETEYLYEDSDRLVSSSYRVAIASNSKWGSSGMVFPTCEESGEQIPTINLIKPTPIADTNVKLSWMAKCNTEGIAYYTIEYCIAMSQKPDDCQNKTKQSLAVNGSATEFVIGKLYPYETYLFTIYPNMKNGNKGKTSDPERVTTLEGKPTEPSELQATNVTNTSIALVWNAPVKSNGFITYYIYSNTERVPINHNKTVHVLEGLKSYENYTIYVEACTPRNCSDPSNTIFERTLMGTPSRPGVPKASFNNATFMNITWEKPVAPRGPLVYDISVEEDGVKQPLLHNTVGEEFHYKCRLKSTKVKVQVRGVNIDETTNKSFVGEWSDTFEGTCSPDISLYIIVVLAIVILPALAFLTKKLYERFRFMMDVEAPKLPLGLAQNQPQLELKISSSPSKPPEPDKVSLLGKPGDFKNHYGDSSGCSSAQDGSVNSESDATVSAGSDSGTDQGELRRRSFRNSKTCLLVDNARPENYSQVGIETNPLADVDDVQPSITFSDLEPTIKPVEPQATAYVTAQARSHNAKPPKEDTINNGYVQVSDAMKTAAQKRDPIVDSKLSYVTVGQMPKMNKHFDVKFNKED